ncbi:MAG: ROK family protein [Ignavibacteria bacterium]|nr:MAG: ROK family protein [Ignavibacteria bacterium]
MITIGVDIGGSSIKAALTDPEVGRIFEIARRPTFANSSQKVTIEQIHTCIETLIRFAGGENLTVNGIGIGVPGTVDVERGIVYHPPNLPAWEEVPLAEEIHTAWDMDVRLDNDANCAALGEAHFGAGRDMQHFIGLTLGTGVGSGIIINRRIFHGEHGFAGEFGHLTIDQNGVKCNCGGRGCIEAYIGIHYMMQEAVPLLRDDPRSPLQQRAADDPASLSPEDLSTAADAGDRSSASILRTAGERLGAAVASAANLMDITSFIVGGGISAAGDVLFDGVRQSARERVLRVHRDHLRILPAQTGNDAGMLGAASLLV